MKHCHYKELLSVGTEPHLVMLVCIDQLSFIFPAANGLTKLRWCVTSGPEMKKCNQMKEAFESAKIQPLISCVTGNSAMDCAKKIVV